MKHLLPAALCIGIACVWVNFGAPGYRYNPSIPCRHFEFTYLVHVPKLPVGSRELRIWIPIPATSRHQRVSDLELQSPIPYRIYREPTFGNRSAYFQVNADQTRTSFDIRLTFRAERYEYRVPLPDKDPTVTSTLFPANIARYLLPNRLIPINGIIAELSREQTEGVQNPLEKARRIYNYVIDHMHYDHTGTGWGHGDALFACTRHHGNCTDFHSLFIGMARAAGIPARFRIGFPLPRNRNEGSVAGYHCWAEFYIRGIGWVPIDASEAWLNPARREYYFGALGPNRIRFTQGRDLVLSPEQHGGPVNFFVYPYAELDGKRFTKLTHEFFFKDFAP